MAVLKRVSKRTGKVSWQAVISRTDPVTGRRVRTVVGTRPTKGEAKAIEAKALVKQSEGTLLSKSTATVEDLLTSWLASRDRTVKTNTHVDYAGAVKNHLVPALGHVLMQSVTPPSVQYIVNSWKEQGKGVRTITTAYRVLSAAYDHALALRLAEYNPCQGVILPVEESPREVPVWTEAQLQQFRSYIEGDTYEPLYTLLIETGIRLGEALGLHWEAIRWDTSTIYIGPTAVPDKSNGGAMKVQQSGKTEAARRPIAIPLSLLNMLREHRRRHMDTVLVFESRNGQPLSHSWPRKKLKVLCERAGVPVIRPHDFRHLAITRMVRAGVPEAVARQRAGHSSGNVTKIYQHADADLQREAVAALEALAARALPGDTDSMENGNDSGDSGEVASPVATGKVVPEVGIEPTTFCSEDRRDGVGHGRKRPKA